MPNTVNPNVVAFAKGDVNGDGRYENVYLTGEKTSDSPFTQNITLVIQNVRTGKLTRIPLKDNVGYNPTLFLGDFTGDKVDDILIGIATGGSGGIMIYYIYSFLNNVPKLMFDYNVYNEQYQYSVQYQNYYKVQVISKINNAKYIIDLTYKGPEYLNEIYDVNGILKAPIEGFVNPIGGMYPVDFDANGVYELLVFQKIAGRYNADAIGYIENSLKWQNNQFVLFNQYVAIFGAEIS